MNTTYENLQPAYMSVLNHVATVTINRPEAMNAIDPETSERLSGFWKEIRDNDDIWVAVVTGTGGKAFCAGADLKKAIPRGQTDNPSQPFKSQGIPSLDDGFELWKPVIAAVDGYCLGAGMTLLSACDIRIASTTSSFGLPEVKRGIVPTLGATQRFPRQLPWSTALEMLLLGDMFGAEDALRYGLINQVVDSSDVMATAMNYATRLTTEVAPLTTRAIKEAAIRSQSLSLEEGIRLERLLSNHVNRTDDAKEGPRAFAEKRPPAYRAQ